MKKTLFSISCFLGDIDRWRKLKKNSVDGSQDCPSERAFISMIYSVLLLHSLKHDMSEITNIADRNVHITQHRACKSRNVATLICQKAGMSGKTQWYWKSSSPGGNSALILTCKKHAHKEKKKKTQEYIIRKRRRSRRRRTRRRIIIIRIGRITIIIILVT